MLVKYLRWRVNCRLLQNSAIEVTEEKLANLIHTAVNRK